MSVATRFNMAAPSI